MTAYQFTLITSPPSYHRFTKNIALLLSGAAIAVAYAAYRRRRLLRHLQGHPTTPTSTTSSPIKSSLESKAIVDAFLQQHFGKPEEDLRPFLLFPPTQSTGPTDFNNHIKNLAETIGILAERHCSALQDFTGEYEQPMALDVGCGVGAVSFELARSFPLVVGVDTSKPLVHAAMTLKERGWMRFARVDEGEVTSEHAAVVPDDVDRDRIVGFYQVEDVTRLVHASGKVGGGGSGSSGVGSVSLRGPYDTVVLSNTIMDGGVINVLTLLQSLSELVRQGGGIVIIATTYANVIGGGEDKAIQVEGHREGEGDGRARRVVVEALTASKQHGMQGGLFELVTVQKQAVVVREDQRHYRVELADILVFRKK